MPTDSSSPTPAPPSSSSPSFSGAPSPPLSRRGALREQARSIGGALFIALLLRAFVVEAYEIPSGSMIPTLQVGDHIFVNKFIYGLRLPLTEHKLGDTLSPPRAGDVVVFVHPKTGDDLIKRVVATAGDTVSVERGVVSVNGVPLPTRATGGACRYHDYLEADERWTVRDCTSFHERVGAADVVTLRDPTAPTPDFAPVVVPAGKLFVLGDNRDNSSDSRYWGFVPLGLVKGKAMVVWWSRGEPEGFRYARLFHHID